MPQRNVVDEQVLRVSASRIRAVAHREAPDRGGSDGSLLCLTSRHPRATFAIKRDQMARAGEDRPVFTRDGLIVFRGNRLRPMNTSLEQNDRALRGRADDGLD